MPYSPSSPLTNYNYNARTLLGQLDEKTIRLIIDKSSKLKFKKSKLIVEENARNLNLYFVLAGGVRASYVSKDGKEISLADIGPGDCFGEFSVIDGQSTSASVVATEDSQLALISRNDFVNLLAESQDFVHILLRHLVSKIRQRTIRIIEFSSLPVGQRVRAELLRLATPVSGVYDLGTIDHPPTQSDLATFISSHREAVAREMAELTRIGLITKVDGKITIHSISKLRASIIGIAELV